MNPPSFHEKTNKQQRTNIINPSNTSNSKPKPLTIITMVTIVTSSFFPTHHQNERIDEENKVRLTSQARRSKVFERRKEDAKTAIILRALQEASDLDALRKEKRIIMEEERRLKALLDIEKTKAHRKADRLAAARAERQRKSAKAEYRRLANKEMLDDQKARENDLLRAKHEVSPHPDNTFSSFH